jgi:hypothetical protein
MNGLTIKDIEVLMEALEAWEREEGLKGVVGIMIGGLMAPDKEAREKIFAEQEEKAKEKHELTKANKEIAILLKAKLLLMKQELLEQKRADE